MKTLLIFPPQGDPFQPYLSLPALAAFLRDHGREVALRDLNIECHHYYTSPGRLSRACASVREAMDEFDRMPFLRFKDQGRYMRLAKAALYGPMVVERIEWAKRILKSHDDFFDLGQYCKALDVFQKALQLISAEYHPAKLTHVSFSCGYSPDSVLDILSAARDKAQNPFNEFYQEVFVPELKRNPPDVVGISITYRHQIIPGFTLARAIKAALPRVKIVVGGSIMSSIADKLPSCAGLFALADYFVLYEGEHALLKLIECLEDGGDLSEVPNLLYMEGGEVKKSKPFHVEDLNDLPTPDFDGLPLDKYLSPNLVMLLATSRGCYWRKCTFCTVSSATNKRYRQRRISLVVDDIRKLKAKYKSPYFFFSVDVMPANALKTLSRALLEQQVECYWQCEVRLDPAFDFNLCDLMYRAGCRNLMFGMESANQRVLNMMAKGTRVEHFPSILRSCNSSGIATTLFCITGFPSETVDEAEDTLNFVLKHREIITSATFSSFLLNEGSPVELDPGKYGIVKVNKTEEDLRKDYSYEVASGQTMDEAEQVHQIIEETLDGVFPIRHYFTGLHPHVLMHLVHYGDPKFAAKIGDTTPVMSRTADVGPSSTLSSVPALESRIFYFDWRDLDERLEQALSQVRAIEVEEGMAPSQAETMVDRRMPPLPRSLTRVVYNPDRDRYHFVSSGAWRLLRVFNGGARVEGVLDSVPPEARERTLEFIRTMERAGLLCRARGDAALYSQARQSSAAAFQGRVPG
jgi:anaerobic magnesium-protoporphyrin IX monomethyl ester cyclase